MDMAETSPDHEMVDRDTPTAIKLPYPEFSVLEDGKEGRFLPQIGGDAGAARVYRAWAAKALEADPSENISLGSIFEHLRSTFTPPPGIPMIQDASGLLPYLPGNASTPRKKRSSKEIKGDTSMIEGFRLKQPTFDEMSDVWKSVGMSLLRWALAAFERDRADSMEQNLDDREGRAGSSSRGEESPTVSGSNSTSNGNSLNGAGASTSTGGGSANSPRNEVDGQDAFGLAVLPDSAFVITSPNALPFPEICVRRNIDTEPAVQHKDTGTNPKMTAMKKDTETINGIETMQTTCEPQKIRKKALYAEQRIGPEGSRTVALAWLNAVTIANNDPSTAHYTRLDSIYNLYRAYAYHPFRCPVLDYQAFEEVLIQAVGAEGVVDGLHDGQVEPDTDEGNADGDRGDNMGGRPEMEEIDGSVSVSETIMRVSTTATTSLPAISTTTATAETTVMSSTAPTDPSNPRPKPNSPSRLIRLTVRPPDKVIQKSHEAIWESVGMNWKKARTFGWDEGRMVGMRKREFGGTQGRAKVKIKAKDGIEEGGERRKFVGMDSGMSMAAGVGRTVYTGPSISTGTAPRPGPGPGLGIRTEMAPHPMAGMRTSGPPTLRPIEVRPRAAIGSPGRVPPDFVTIWLSQTYRPAPLGCGRSTPQKELWQDYTRLVRHHSGAYESDLRRYGALKERVDAMARAIPYPSDSTITTTSISKAESHQHLLYQTQILSQELVRLTQLHRALGYYMDLQPAGLFGLVSSMFGCTLGRMGDGGYGLDGLERIRLSGAEVGVGAGVRGRVEVEGGIAGGRGVYNGDVWRDGMR